ncbi:hypothetical protein F0L68_07130 [Solihabitans fulvus]|uniref:Uncharacterized protein n=1 Tax=Solihabitans fulvus TaxID=1892852 RepID=A0A5B2XPP9_9PSEU|nr:hypothetical protein [Solihabitans fulvus]KAA2264842.1 hypothetical protein F0L68_07130 [Solihabitans fulvus]
MADSTEPTPPPRALRAAVGVWLALAVFGLLITAILWFTKDAVRRQLISGNYVAVDRADDLTHSLLIQNTIASVFFGASYAGLAVLLWKGRSWARVLLTVVAGLHFFVMLINGVSVPNFLVAALIILGVALTWRGSTRRWLAQ